MPETESHGGRRLEPLARPGGLVLTENPSPGGMVEQRLDVVLVDQELDEIFQAHARTGEVSPGDLALNLGISQVRCHSQVQVGIAQCKIAWVPMVGNNSVMCRLRRVGEYVAVFAHMRLECSVGMRFHRTCLRHRDIESTAIARGDESRLPEQQFVDFGRLPIRQYSTVCYAAKRLVHTAGELFYCFLSVSCGHELSRPERLGQAKPTQRFPDSRLRRGGRSRRAAAAS